MSKHVIMLLSAIVLWGTTIPPTKWALESVPPFTLIFLRLFLATLLLGPSIWQQTRRKKNKPVIPWLRMFTLSFTGVVGFFVINNIGLSMTSALDAAILIASLPLFTLLLSSIYLKEPITVSQWCGLLLGVAGVLMITVYPGMPVKKGSIIGDGLILLSCLVWAIYIVQMKRPKGEERLSNAMFTFLTFFLGAVMLFPVALTEMINQVHFVFKWKAVLSILFLTLIPTIAAYWLWNKALLHISGSTASAYLNTLPLFSVLFSILLLGESLTWRMVAGALLIFVGIVWTEKKWALV